MDVAERGICEEEQYKPRRWWRKIKWKRICLYLGIALFLYDFSYCVIVYFYIKAMNRNPEFRLMMYKTNSRFMKLYYTLHYYFGDASLQEADTITWQERGNL